MFSKGKLASKPQKHMDTTSESETENDDQNTDIGGYCQLKIIYH
jgi:hypothetical protein